ncbi:MAG: phosphoribosylaminoimidazolesuccinocarboxamide synthase [Actinomyces sp.]|nr:MAG: phosphoribosylaminoimidazolesuccinocarboxamide synthase [Actinomyces sp.]
MGDHLALIATDRVSAFDHVLGTVPYRGQVLTELAAWWFGQVADLIGSHLVAVIDPNVAVVRACTPLPVEVVVRGHLTGSTSTSIWTRYAAGERTIYGIRFPDGLVKNDPLPEPVVTPTTKAAHGAHDEPVTESEIVERGLVDADLWERVRHRALAVFERGRRVAAAAGLVLVDTKYEFGLDPAGELVLIDEIHTPDSSRYWRAATVEQRRRAGEEPENLDKEVIRLAYVAGGYRGEGPPPPLDDELAERTARVYIAVLEALTGRPFAPGAYPAAPRVVSALRSWVEAGGGHGN